MAAMSIEKLSSIDTRLAVIETTVTRLDKAMHGNGKPGLSDRVQCVEHLVDNHLAEYKEHIQNRNDSEKARREFWNRVVLAIIAMVVSNIGTIIFALFK